MTTWFDWFDKTCADASATEDGKAFLAAGYEIYHSGGGCMHWVKEISPYWEIWVNSGGTGLTLNPEYDDDAWDVGVQGAGGEFSTYAYELASPKTVTGALDRAAVLESFLHANDFAALKMDNVYPDDTVLSLDMPLPA